MLEALDLMKKYLERIKMNHEEYLAWCERIKAILRMDDESEEFITFVIDWISKIKGKAEVKLVSEYHPDFENSTDEEIFDFISRARLVPQNFEDKYFKLQIFDSALFLYRPLLKLKFLKGDID